MDTEGARFERLRDAVKAHQDASGAIPAGEVPSLLDHVAEVVESAYVQGLEDAQ